MLANIQFTDPDISHIVDENLLDEVTVSELSRTDREFFVEISLDGASVPFGLRKLRDGVVEAYDLERDIPAFTSHEIVPERNASGYSIHDPLHPWTRQGVADSVGQVLERRPEFANDPDHEYLLEVITVKKSEEVPGGWRWQKWGEYIGDRKPQCEYLYDEPEIDEVICYHFYKVRAKDPSENNQ